MSCVAEDHGRFLGVPSLGVVIQTSENAAIKHKYSLESRHGVVVTKVVELSSAAGVLEEGDGKLCRLRSVPALTLCHAFSPQLKKRRCTVIMQVDNEPLGEDVSPPAAVLGSPRLRLPSDDFNPLAKSGIFGAPD